MLKIYVNNALADFDGNITMKIDSPLFKKSGTFSFPFTFPLTETNKHIFNYQYRSDISGKGKVEYQCTIETGVMSFEGLLIVEKSGGGVIDANFIGGQRSFFVKNDNLYLQDIGYDTVNIDFAYASRTVNKYYPETNFVFPIIYNEKFGDKMALTDKSEWVTNYFSPTQNRIDTFGSPLVPYFYLNFLIDHIFRKLKYEIRYNELSNDADLKKLIIHNTCAQNSLLYEKVGEYGVIGYANTDPMIVDYVRIGGEVIKENDFVLFNSESGSFLESLGYVQVKGTEEGKIELLNVDGRFAGLFVSGNDSRFDLYRCQYGYAGTYASLKPENHLPYIKISEFIESIENMLAVKFVFSDFFNWMYIKSWDELLSQKDIVNITQFLSEEIVWEESKENGFLIEHELDNSDDTQDIEDVYKYNIKESVSSRNALPLEGNSQGDVRLVVDENYYYIFKNLNLGGYSSWKVFTPNYLPKFEGEKDIKIISKASAVSSMHGYFRPGYEVMIPMVGQPGTIYGLMNKTFDQAIKSLRLLFYHSHNFTSFRNINSATGEKIGDLSLDINDEDGLYNKRWKRYLDWQLNDKREGTTRFQLPAKTLSALDLTKIYRVDNINFFIKTITINFKNTGYEMGDAEIVRL